MQSLTLWHSCVVPQLDLELIPFCSSVNWGGRRKRLGFCNVDNHGLLHHSIYFKGYRNGGNYDLKCKLFCLSSGSNISCFSKAKKGSLGVNFAVSWALDEDEEEPSPSPLVGNDDVTDELDKVPGDMTRVESAHLEVDEVHKGEACGNECDGTYNRYDHGGSSAVDCEEKVRNVNSQTVGDGDGDGDDGIKSGVDHDENVRNVDNQWVDVRALARRLSSARIADDVEEVLKEERILPLQVYSTMIRGFGKDKKLESAVALYEWLKRKSEETGGSIQPNLYIYNSLLGAVKEARKFEFVEGIVNDMAVKGVSPNVVTCNTLMGIYIEEGKESKALRLFEEMPTKGITPSPASFSIVLFGYRRLEDGFGALAFFVGIRDKFKHGEIGRDDDGEDWDLEFSKLENFIVTICYQVMRHWLVKSENRTNDVLRLLTEMDNVGVKHGREDHERLMWACTREEHCVVAKELYTRIREVDSEMSLSVCNHLVWLLGKAKKWWAALEIYEDMLDKGPKPNNMSYELIMSHFNILLSAARKKGIWRWGVRLLNKMEEKGLKPGSREWNSVLIACSKAAETSAAIEIFKRMVDQGEKPTIISYGALLSALEKGKLYEQALRVWDHMLKVGVEPNLYAYTIMASIYASHGKFDILDSVIKEMATVGVAPTVVTYNAIISSCGRNGHEGVAYEWFERMKVENIVPNEVTYEMLIEALAKDGKPRLAYELHLRAQNEGLELSAKAYDAVVQSMEFYGATVEVGALGPRPPERKKKVQIRKNLSEFCTLADVPRRSRPFVRKEIYTSKGE